MCFHPKLNKTLPVFTPIEIERVIDEYAPECPELSAFVFVNLSGYLRIEMTFP